METLASLQRKIKSAGEIKSVVRAMKAMAASNIVQYQTAVASVEDYFHTVALGIIAYFKEDKRNLIDTKNGENQKKEKLICAIVFGSDQGLVGKFNDSLSDFVYESFNKMSGKKKVWAIGERVQVLLDDLGFFTSELFRVPNSVDAIDSLVGQILVKSQDSTENGHHIDEFYIFHNQQQSATSYLPKMQQFLPLSDNWMQTLQETPWPTNKPPQVIGGSQQTLKALIREYLFVSLFKACAESLACENSSRLTAMQGAEKNVEELLVTIEQEFHGLRQSSIDAELFDIVSSYEALNKK